MSFKHFLNDPTKLVQDSLQSNTLINPAVAFERNHKIVYRRPTSQSNSDVKVSIISGGGSGHEPGFAGYVGKGLLTASVAGTIFASPSAEQVRQAFRHVPTGNGVFVLIMDYTGDVLNFGMAVEEARARGIAAELFAVGDDVGVGRTKSGKVGRRGLAGTVLIMKMCCALAESGGTLEQVRRLAQQVAANTITVGASLDHVHVPGRALPIKGFGHGSDEVEIGMGIHNEPGSVRATKNLQELIKTMLAQLLDPNDADRAYVFVQTGESVVLLLNNLGGVSALEMGAILTEVAEQLDGRYGLRPVRVLSGAFLSSLNGPGFSITLLKLDNTGLDSGESMVELLDSDAEAAGWSTPVSASAWSMTQDTGTSYSQAVEDITQRSQSSSRLIIDAVATRRALESALHRLIVAEPEVTQYDTIVGDGDCGVGMKRGADALLADLKYPSSSLDAVSFVYEIKTVIETAMDGTSGAIFTIFLSGLVQGLRKLNTEGRMKSVNTADWSSALQYALETLNKYTPAKPGDRTLMDALVPFIKALAASQDVNKAAEAAALGAESTKSLKPGLGRSVYVGDEASWLGTIPDPGAWAVSQFLQGLAEAI